MKTTVERIHSNHTRLYVWELPVRFFHWLNAACIVVLCLTGYLIGDPPALVRSQEAWQLYGFAWVRFIHFAAAFVFIFNFVFRIYWGFVGNKYADWRNFLLYRKDQVRELVNVLKIDVFMVSNDAHLITSHGHNMLASLTYFGFFVLSLFQIISGFGLYAPMSTWQMVGWFTWIVPLMGGDAVVRQWHHIVMWFYIIFTMFHIYIVFYHDYVEKNGITSSMFSGWKFLEQPGSKVSHVPEEEVAGHHHTPTT
jgi:Ni/Fe-hydrogenase 1 B-type cytochrome subunit